jgi:hypothetical protein
MLSAATIRRRCDKRVRAWCGIELLAVSICGEEHLLAEHLRKLFGAAHLLAPLLGGQLIGGLWAA